MQVNTPPTQHSHRLGHIDGLKGISACIVLFSHIYMLFPEHLSIFRFPGINLFINGHYAVFIFLVLSGYSLSYSFERKNPFAAARGITINRYISFFFSFSCPIIISFILFNSDLYFNHAFSTLFGNPTLDKYWNIDPNWLCLLKNLFFAPFGCKELISPLWAIQYLFFGAFFVYTIFYAFCPQKTTSTRALLPQIIFAGLLSYLSICYTVMIMGAIIRNNEKKIYTLFKKNKIWTYVAVIFFCSCFISSSRISMLISSCCLVILLVTTNVLQNLLSKKIFIWLGNISLSLYVLHWPIIGSLTCYLCVLLHGHISESLIVLIATISTLIICMLLAWCYSTIIEKKYLKVMSKKTSLWLNSFFE